MWKLIDQALILCLMADAAWVCVGLATGRVMWAWIVAYWAILTAKNAVAWLAGRKRKPKRGADLAPQIREYYSEAVIREVAGRYRR